MNPTCGVDTEGVDGEVERQNKGRIKRSRTPLPSPLLAWGDKLSSFTFTVVSHFVLHSQVKYSVDRGMSSAASSRLVLFMGINIVLGRFVSGFLCSIKRLDNWFILQGMAITNGVSTMLLALANSYEWLVAYSVIFGFCDGAMGVLVNIIALTCVDPSKAGSAFGNVLLATSLVTLVGPPLSGMDNTMKRN